MCSTHAAQQEEIVAELLGDPQSAQTALIFLPVREGAAGLPVLDAMPSQAQPLAWRRDANGTESVRHYVLGAVTDGELPKKLTVRWDSSEPIPTPHDSSVPQLEVVPIARKTLGVLITETNEVHIKGSSGTLGIRMGLETKDGTLWWEWVTASCLWSGPVCSSWRVGGYALGRREEESEAITQRWGYIHPEVHRHNWIYCELHLLMFVNGVIRIHARHINNRFFDRGRSLHDVLPVIGFSLPNGQVPGGNENWEPVRGEEVNIGGVRLNLDEAATLSSEAQPAQTRWIDGVLHYRPYAGVEIYGRQHNPAYDRAIRKVVGVEDRQIPRGVARTVRLTAALGAAAPRIARYRLPGWYHAVCGNLWPGAALPVRGDTQPMMEEGARWLCENMRKNCYDDGSVARSRPRRDPDSIPESGWEGETPFALLRYYHLTGDGEALQAALRDAYNVADVATDHTDMAVRMHGRRMGARSLPMQRVLGVIAGYLETGDPYLLETGQAVVDHAYWWDRSNWPRRSIGRDAAYVRGLLALSDVTDCEHYLERAREALRRFAERQLDNGAFADQGGTAGFHGNVNAVVKPWMNCIMAEAMLDFLERSDDSLIEAAVLRIAQWLAVAALKDENGEVSWAYKYRHGENDVLPWAPEHRFPLGRGTRGPYPYVLRPLLFATRRTGDPLFVDLCFRNLRKDPRPGWDMDQTANKKVEQTSWFETHLWDARWQDGALSLSPASLPDGQEIKGNISTPSGEIPIRAVREGSILKVTLPEKRNCDVRVSVSDKTITIGADQTSGQIELGSG
jgi:hypothetical protein